MPDKKISDLGDGGDPQATDEFVVARGGDNFKLAWSSLSNAATRNNVALTLDGNTAGVLALVSSGTLTLAGGNNITVSQAGNAVTISGPNVGGAQTGISGLANSETTYTSGTVNLSVVAGNLTIRSTTGNAFQFSASQSVQAETQTFVGGIANSQTTYTSGTVSLSELGAITIRSTTGNQFQLSVNAQSAQTGISGIANSQTTYTSGTVSLSELGAITIRSTTGNQYQLSVNAQSTQTQGILSAGVSTGGNTAGNTTVNTGSRFVLVASGNATASQATAAGASTVTISVGTQTVQTQGVLSAGISNIGNTSGDSTVNTGSRLVLAGGNNITLSQSTAAGASTITISAGAGGAGMSAGISGGNTSGDTGTVTGRVVFAGGNNITLSGSSNAGSMTVTISAPNLGAGAMSAGVSNLGNTAGSTGVTGTRLVLVGTNWVSLSQSTDANGGTVTVNVPQVVLSELQPRSHLLMAATQGIGASAATQTTVTAFVMPMSLPQDLAFNNLFLAANVSFTSATTSISSINYSFSQGASLGFYTLNGSTMSLVTSFSQTLGFTNATSANATDLKATGDVAWGGSHQSIVITGAANMSSIMSSIQGVRKLPLVWSTQSLTLTRGQYWAVACFSALTGGNNQASLSQIGMVSSMSIMGSAYNPPAMMKSTASVTSPFIFFGQATLVNSSNQLMPASFNTNAITVSTNTNASTKFQSVWFQIYSSHSN